MKLESLLDNIDKMISMPNLVQGYNKMILVILIAILGFLTYTNTNKSYAAQYIRLSLPLTEGEHQFLTN
jgi:hypothetical protein